MLITMYHIGTFLASGHSSAYWHMQYEDIPWPQVIKDKLKLRKLKGKGKRNSLQPAAKVSDTQ